MPILTAKILETRCKSCGYHTVAWWSKTLSKNRLCVDCNKEILRQKRANKPPSKQELARRADFALFEMIGSNKIPYSFVQAVTSENSGKVKRMAIRTVFLNVDMRYYPTVSYSDTMQRVTDKKQRGAIPKTKNRLSLRLRRLTLTEWKNNALQI